MKHLPLLGAALISLGLASCQSSSQATNHWHIDHVGTSVGHAFFGTVPSDWTVFKEEAGGGAGHIGQTLSRHFLNVNTDNPLQPEVRATGTSHPQPPEREFTVGD
jgi:hypothetical protein